MLTILVWYLICACLIALVVWFFRFTNMPASRSELGDITTEVGYWENPDGYPLDNFEHDTEATDGFKPHADAPANCGSGPF